MAISLLIPTVVLAQDRMYVYQEGNVRSEMILIAACPEEGTRMEKRKAARIAAINQGFKDGSCLSETNYGEMRAMYTVGIPALFHLTPVEVEQFRAVADEAGEAFVTSPSMP